MARSPDNPSDALTERYDIEAREYHAHWAPVLEAPARRMIEEIPASSPRRVLDVGAGTGQLLPVLAARFPGAAICAVDRSQGMLAIARARTEREDDAIATPCSVAVMDAMALGFRPAAFDIAVMSFMLFHLPDAADGLREVRRVLRPGGSVYLTTWAEDIASPPVDIWNEELDAHGAPDAQTFGRLANHDAMDTPEKVMDLLVQAGFTEPASITRPFNHDLSVDAFVALRTGVGTNRQRVEAMSESARRSCMARVRQRMGELSPGERRIVMRVIFSSATA